MEIGLNDNKLINDIIEGKSVKPLWKKVNLNEFMNVYHKWFEFNDEEVVHTQLATLISEKMPGDPLWVFIIAPPGGLKTETLRGFIFGEDFYPLSDLTSKTFVSGLMIGTGKKRRKIDDLLPELNRKILIFKDFTTVLEKRPEERQEIFSQLREIYDGEFSKKFGTTDNSIRYNSRFGLIAGVTPVIDRIWKLMQQLGERFLKIRWNEDMKKVTKKARENGGKENEMRAEISQTAMNFITYLDFSKVPEFDDDKYGEVLDNFAMFVALCRTPVSIQDYRTDFYFDYIPIPEMPTRLVKQLKKMSICLSKIRDKEKVDDDEIKTLRRISKDTCPQDRVKVLEIIGKYEHLTLEGCPRPAIYTETRLPQSSIIRVLEQLRLLELVFVKIHKGNDFTEEYYYKLSDIARKVLCPPMNTTGACSKDTGGEQ